MRYRHNLTTIARVFSRYVGTAAAGMAESGRTDR
jgi:hypothetical protein